MIEQRKIDELEEYHFRKHYSLNENLAYWARRLNRDANRHKQEEQLFVGRKDIEGVAQKVFHGVNAANKRRFCRMILAIKKKMKEERNLP